MPLQRQLHWATRALHDFLLARASTPFAWGINDCCLFPADAILAFTGTDIADDFRGKYSDEASAFALIQTVTGIGTDPKTAVADAAAWCAAKHGLVEWTYPLMAQRGDLVVFENGGRLIAGLVHLSGRHVISMSDTGIVKLLITPTLIRRSWHV
jgi:hypothetical protein